MANDNYMKVGQGLYLLFVALAICALNLASNGALVLGAKYMLTWMVHAIQAFI